MKRLSIYRLRVTAEGWGQPYATPLLFVGNNTYSAAAPEPGVRKTLDGGTLCLYVMRGQGRWAVARTALRAAFGRLKGGRDIEMRLVTEAEIQSLGRRRMLRVSMDGEVTRMLLPLRYRIRPAALRFFAPPPP